MSYTGGSIADLYRDAETIAHDATRELAVAAGDFALDRARELAPLSVPFGSRLSPPGALKESYYVTEPEPILRVPDTGFEVRVQSDDPVARWVETGVRAHVVKAKRGRYLTFTTIDGRKVRVRWVSQRGYAGRHVISHALTMTHVAFAEIAEPALQRWRDRQLAASTRR